MDGWSLIIWGRCLFTRVLAQLPLWGSGNV